jgi:hypothetical protein
VEKGLLTIHPLPQEPFLVAIGGDPRDIGDPEVHLHASIALRLHVEAGLGWQDGRAGQPRSLILAMSVHLRELHAEITFLSDDENGHGSEHDGKRRAVAAIIPPRYTIKTPIQHFAPPAKGASDVWVSTPAPECDPPWVEQYVGQLERETLTFDQHLSVPVTMDVAFTSDERQGGGAELAMVGELRFEQAVRVQLLFRDPGQSTSLSSASDSGEVVMVGAGSRVLIPRQTLSGMADRDARMIACVIEPDGWVVCAEHELALPRSAAREDESA